MFSKLIRTTLVSTVLAPVALTTSFCILNNDGFSIEALLWFLIALFLVFFGYIILRIAPNKLECFSEKLVSIKNGDTEIIQHVLPYLIPLFGSTPLPFSVNYNMILYVSSLLLLIFWNSNALYFNPILKLFGYHIYEVVLVNQVNVTLLTKRILRGIPDEDLIIVRLAEYVFLEKDYHDD